MYIYIYGEGNEGTSWCEAKIKEFNLIGAKVKALHSKCPIIYRKSVLHLFKYRFSVYLSRCSTYLR